jgi:glucosamine--fructose-6-phosphate aminotransferase (isomerizing)
MLEQNEGHIKEIANKLASFRDFFFISRGISYVSSLEGALKLKEVTYLHAESYPAGELKHGPISLLSQDVVVVAIVPSDEHFKKMMSNIQECKARGAKIVVMSDSQEALNSADYSIKMPKCESDLCVLHYVICLQLLAYFMAKKLGRDADKPRNLAKSVTVE